MRQHMGTRCRLGQEGIHLGEFPRVFLRWGLLLTGYAGTMVCYLGIQHWGENGSMLTKLDRPWRRPRWSYHHRPSELSAVLNGQQDMASHNRCRQPSWRCHGQVTRCGRPGHGLWRMSGCWYWWTCYHCRSSALEIRGRPDH